MKKILIHIVLVMALSTVAMSDVKSPEDERAKEFIAKNLVILTKEVSIGRGESIDTLAELLSIHDVDKFSLFLQTKYKYTKNIDTTLNTKVADEFKRISLLDTQFTTN